mmetsp:Transcript_17633/g.15550  ORF Transcript_17633/g.15550 Transcript_17633/m.15550 type:complete len:171 (+) Transcript_17633:538-1050(+)
MDFESSPFYTQRNRSKEIVTSPNKEDYQDVKKSLKFTKKSMENLYSVRHLKRVQEKAKQKLAKIEKNIKKSKKDIRRRLEGKKNKDNFYKNKFVIKTDEVPKSSIKKSSTTKVSKTSRYKKKDKLFKLLNSAVDTRNQRSKERVRRNKSKGESNISNNDLLDSIIICGSK